MSRKIDALVAEHVMGLDWRRQNSAGCTTKYQYCPNYSTEIVDAWQVLNHCKDGHPNGVEWDAEGYWFCLIPYRGNNWEIISSKSAPMAICFAALKERGVEVGDDVRML